MADVLGKVPTGIVGLDEITLGGFPAGRPTLLCGDPGAGKTLLALSFLVNGAEQYGEPGVLMTFEENAEEIARDVASLGFDLDRLVAERKLAIDYVHLERSEIEETGDYDLEGLFVRLGYAVSSIGAKRVVLDTIEALFGGLSNAAVLRAELRRLFRWLKDRKLTAVVTAEKGGGALTRQGLEEYVSDAVILLDHRVVDQISTRRLRIVKYRGSHHGTNEYPFLITARGLSVVPITSLGLAHSVSSETISSGIAGLDRMLGTSGFYRGSSVLVSGTSGTGKTSFTSQFIDGVCRRGERGLMFLFEESPAQLVRNMRSIGIDLEEWIGRGLLQMQADRPSQFGLESHLESIYTAVRAFAPDAVVIDPISSLLDASSTRQVQGMLTRVVDFLKAHRITTLLTTAGAPPGGGPFDATQISSLMDAWILLDYERRGERRRRTISVLKSRGMAHSDEIRAFQLTDRGIEIGGTPVSQDRALEVT